MARHPGKRLRNIVVLLLFGLVLAGPAVAAAPAPGPRGSPAPLTEVIVWDPTIHPPYCIEPCGCGMCCSAWYRFVNNFGHYTYLTLNTNDPAQAKNWSAWRPNLPVEGNYKVEALVAAHIHIYWNCPYKWIEWDTSQAPYTIHHAAGATTVYRDQNPLFDEWLDLGTYHFNQGTGGWVELHDVNGEANWSTTISHSAMRFTLVGPPPPSCDVPFFSQRDPRWANHPLRTAGQCSPSCGTIGACGCTLTSAAMLFRYFGANLTPASLSDCMWTSACPFYWGVGANCSQGRARWVNIYGFSWSQLQRELNQNHRPVILGMHKGAYTHWVLVIGGSGATPSGYRIHDPWPLDGRNMSLSAYSSWWFDYLAVYAGQGPCSGSLAPASEAGSFSPQPAWATLPAAAHPNAERLSAAEAAGLPASDAVTGTVQLYRMTDVTMTLYLDFADEVTEMLVWSDSLTQTAWQPVHSFVYLPRSEHIYARFRNGMGALSPLAEDTLYPPAAPPVAPFEIYLPLVARSN